MFQASRQLPGFLVAVVLLSQLPIAAQADDHDVGLFTSAELTTQRMVFRDLLSRISSDMTRADFEHIVGRKLTTGSLGGDAGMGGRSDDYSTSYRYDNYFYGFNYVEIHRASSTTFHIIAFFDHSGDMDADDAGCLSLDNIKEYAEVGGWKVDAPHVISWTDHGMGGPKADCISRHRRPAASQKVIREINHMPHGSPKMAFVDALLRLQLAKPNRVSNLNKIQTSPCGQKQPCPMFGLGQLRRRRPVSRLKRNSLCECGYVENLGLSRHMRWTCRYHRHALKICRISEQNEHDASGMAG